jgi:methylenetetrahydrofolate reductase (NADPH)
VLQRRARDVTRLMLPHTPEDMLRDLAAHKAAHPDFPVETVHLFPLGGLRAAADFTAEHSASAAPRAARG